MISYDLRKKIMDCCMFIPNICDPDVRNGFIQGCGFDVQLVNQINMRGAPLEFFQVLVPILDSYGYLQDGRIALDALLIAVDKYVGKDKQYDIQIVRNELLGIHIDCGIETYISEEKSMMTTQMPGVNVTISEVEISGTIPDPELLKAEFLRLNQHNSDVKVIGDDVYVGRQKIQFTKEFIDGLARLLKNRQYFLQLTEIQKETDPIMIGVAFQLGLFTMIVQPKIVEIEDWMS